MAASTELLAEAELAYHRLMTGTSIVEVHDSNGEVIKYGLASATKLSAYIESLKRTLGQLPAGTGPMRVWF
ncbi:MAG: gpW family head-tail joining protein [Devosia sp.]|nr:gpW family head-tail joining protein [Devosia sp.]